jgi:hypothetical protein
MNDSLSTDEYDALMQIAKGQKSVKASACVARNTKRLSGLKYIAFGKDGSLSLTEKGTQTLFVKNCVDGLRALSTDAHAPLDSIVSIFLCKKGHIEAQPEAGGFLLTQKGRETLADIDAQ